jgi:hypothetical protein
MQKYTRELIVNAYYWKDLNKNESINVFDIVIVKRNQYTSIIDIKQMIGVTLTTLKQIFTPIEISEMLENYQKNK